jgi:hypothetical protein
VGKEDRELAIEIFVRFVGDHELANRKRRGAQVGNVQRRDDVQISGANPTFVGVSFSAANLLVKSAGTIGLFSHAPYCQ